MTEPGTPSFGVLAIKDLMMLDAHEFDQGPKGWRSLIGTTPNETIAEVILQYIAQHKAELELPKGNNYPRITVLHFHAAQCYMMGGTAHYAFALPLLEQSRTNYEHSIPWNAYVDATIGFITKDIGKVRTALHLVESTAHQDNKSGNAPFIRSLLNSLASGNYDYKSAYTPK